MTRTCRSLLVLVLVAACGRPGETSTRPPRSETRLELRAEPMAEPGAKVQRYRVSVAAGHGYEPGRLVALFARLPNLPDAQPVGAAEVVELSPHGFELLALWLDPSHLGEPLTLGELPPGHHFGFALGQVVADDRDPRRVRLNMGDAHGVTPGTLYTVLGDALTDANAGGRTLGRREVGTVQVIEVPKRAALAGVRPLAQHLVQAPEADQPL